MGYFDNISDARIGMGGVYFLPGKYVVEVERCFFLKSRQNQPLAIVECEIIESSTQERPEGTRASWVVNLSQDAALGNIKAFLAAANGVDPGDDEAVTREITTPLAELSFSDHNPLAGVRLGLQCTMIKTRKGTDFTRHYWEILADEPSGQAQAAS